MASIVLRLVCVVALLLGTYTVNKDMFIFFKCIAAEQMRLGWLDRFLAERYPSLKEAVVLALKDNSWKARERLLNLWNEGYPEKLSAHRAILGFGSSRGKPLWEEVLRRQRGAPVWMLDIPQIAKWADDVERLIEEHAASLS
jgi:hypothetical protein